MFVRFSSNYRGDERQNGKRMVNDKKKKKEKNKRPSTERKGREREKLVTSWLARVFLKRTGLERHSLK